MAIHDQLPIYRTGVQPVARGIDFVGHVTKPWRRTTRAPCTPRCSG